MHIYRRSAVLWFVMGCLAVGGPWADRGYGQQREGRSPVDPEVVEHAEQLSAAFRNAAEAVLPTVVKIEASRRGTGRPGMARRRRAPNPFEGTPFEDFFEGNEHGFNLERIPQIPQRGVGSGVIIDPTGIILTNRHVVEGFDELKVTLSNGEELVANGVKSDPLTDLAIVRIRSEQANRLPAARFGDSDALRTGDWVLAIGNPFEYDATVSAGIISAMGRGLVGEQSLRAQFLQTDAAINPGNSGGPLVNLRGEVVGINTAIASRTGGFQGIGFAIPSNLAKWVTDQLIERGAVRRAYLGIQIRELDPELREQLDLPSGTRGVAVDAILPNTPAAQAGVQQYDVIVSFDGRPVDSAAELQRLVERVTDDRPRTLEVLRDGRKVPLEVKTIEMTDDLVLGNRRNESSNDEEEATETRFGLAVRNMSPELARQLGYDEGTNGVVIEEVAPGSDAAEKGLQPGMLILHVNRQQVNSVEEFEEAIGKIKEGRGVLLLIRHRDSQRIIALRE